MSRFECTDYQGRQIEINTPTKGMLIGVISDSEHPRRDEAARILKYYEAVANRQVPTEIDRVIQLQVAEIEADALWLKLARLESQKGSDGVEHLQVIWNHLG